MTTAARTPTTLKEETPMRLSGSQVIAQCLKNYGIEYVAGIPGHGAWVLLDAFLEPESSIRSSRCFTSKPLSTWQTAITGPAASRWRR